MKTLGSKLKLAILGLCCLILAIGCQKIEDTTPATHRVQLVVDGKEQQIDTRATTVGQLLDEAGVELGEMDRVEPAEYTSISDGLTISVVRVRVEVVPGEERLVPYERKTVQDSSVPAGQSRILEPGQNGIEQVIYRVVYEDGVEVDRIPVRQITIQQAQPETVLVGVRENFTPTSLPGTVVFLSGNNDVGYNAWVMRRSSGNQRRLTSDGTLDTRVFALSPNGRYLLYTRRTSEDDVQGALNSLWLIDTVRDEDPVDLRLTDVLWADWSPDGETIAYSTGEKTVSAPGWQARNDLWTAVLSDDERLVRRNQVLVGSASGAYFWWGRKYAWSPDRRFVAYAQADSIGYIRLTDGKQIQVYQFPPLRTYSEWVWVPEPSWSPDSRFLTSVVHGPSITGDPPEDSQVFDVWVFDIESSLNIKQVNDAGIWAAPTWSPSYVDDTESYTDSRIAYARARSPYESVNSGYDLYVMDRDGSNRLRIYPAEGDLGLKSPDVVWGPEGRQLITIYQRDLFLIDLDQNASRRLTVDSSVQSVDWER